MAKNSSNKTRIKLTFGIANIMEVSCNGQQTHLHVFMQLEATFMRTF
jgi:hypothetical protein